MAARLKWLTLSPSSFVGSERSSELPSDLQFTIKKPFFTASIFLKYRRVPDVQNSAQHSADTSSAEGDTTKSSRIIAETSLQAKIPVMGNIHYSIQVASVPYPKINASGDSRDSSIAVSKYFAFESVTERDEAKGNYRTVTASANRLTLESPGAGSQTVSKTRDIEIVPPGPLLVHLLALPALQASREADIDIYVAQLVNGLKIQALRLDRLSVSPTAETYRGRVKTVPSELTEEEFRDLEWANTTSFEFDFDLSRNTISAARLQLPIIGKIEIK